MRKLKRQTGFGLLELMLSMVIVALLLIMATRYYQSARSNARINEGVSLISSILNAANNIAIGTGNYTNATAASVAPYLPTTEQGANGTIVNPWGGNVTLAPTTTSLVITFSGLGDDCEKLADALGDGSGKGSYTTYDKSACASGSLGITETLAANPTT